MGPSGAGKTTLLNALSHRLISVTVAGECLLNGKPYGAALLNDMSGYVMQDDVLNARMTVAETLGYASELLLPRTWTRAQRAERVDAVIAEVKLGRSRDTLVGDHFVKGISGGEKKRLSTALVLLKSPRLIFLDEPTSGLDSSTALALCELLKSLSLTRACTVVATLHAPSSKIVQLFDGVILLARGQIVYQGPFRDGIAFFAARGHPLPPKSNPANFFMAVLNGTPPAELAAAAGPGAPPSAPPAVTDKARAGVFAPRNRVLWLKQFTVLTRRNALNAAREWRPMLLQIFINCAIAVILGFYNTIENNVEGISLRVRVFFFGVQVQGYFAAMSVLDSFPAERALQIRERAAGMYSASAYFLARALVETVKFLPAPISFTLCFYFIIPLQMVASKFFIYMGTLMLTTVAACALATAVCAICRTAVIAVVALPLIIDLSRLFSGFYTIPAKQSVGWQVFDQLSYLYYSNNVRAPRRSSAARRAAAHRRPPPTRPRRWSR
jgi:ATP-binding cassette subfamily G (WHITE) protein 2